MSNTPDLFTFKGPMLEECDLPRLNTTARRVWDIMAPGEWQELNELAESIDKPHSSVTACVRAFRYDENGGHTVNTKRKDGEKGTWLYQLVPNSRDDARAAMARAKAAKAPPVDELLELHEWLAEQLNAGRWNYSHGACTLGQHTMAKIDEMVKHRGLRKGQ